MKLKLKLNFHSRKSAPKFLLDVYKRLSDEANEESTRVTRSIDDDENDNFITDLDKLAIEQSDNIMTFLNKSWWHFKSIQIYSKKIAENKFVIKFYNLSENHVAEVRHEHGRKLWFDVSKVSAESTLLMGELRIYQNPSLGRWKDLQKEFVISVYAISKSDKWVQNDIYKFYRSVW